MKKHVFLFVFYVVLPFSSSRMVLNIPTNELFFCRFYWAKISNNFSMYFIYYPSISTSSTDILLAANTFHFCIICTNCVLTCSSFWYISDLCSGHWNARFSVHSSHLKLIFHVANICPYFIIHRSYAFPYFWFNSFFM